MLAVDEIRVLDFGNTLPKAVCSSVDGCCRMTDTLTITIPAVPDSRLFPNAARRTHYMTKSGISRELREVARYAALEQGSISGKVNVHYHIQWPKGRTRPDLDAIPVACKAALDGLVDAGVIDNDGPNTIVRLSASQEKVKGEGCILVVIEPA